MSDHDKLESLGSKDFKAQAIWFLNAFWDTFAQDEAERIWGYAHRLAQIDLNKKMQGNAVDEFQAHQFLEQCKETLTVLQMREHLRSVGIEKHKLVPFVHYLIFRYKVDWHVLVNAPQGNPEEIARAQRMLDEVQAALAEAQRRADAAKAAEKEAAAREADAKRDEAEAKRTEAESRAAQQELEAALAELHAQEESYNNKTEELKRKSEEGSVVQRNKAKNELAQHLGEDPLPLRRAKITQEAAVKKADRATKAAEDAAQAAAQARQAAEKARRAAEQARQAAEQARRAAEQAREAAEEAVREAEEKVAEAQAFLEEVKRLASGGKGALWWIDRELHEAKAYMPTSKGGYKKDK